MNNEIAPVTELLPVFVREMRRYGVTMSILFAVIALAGLVIGIVWPRTYVASTTILAQGSDIIQPLLEGRAVPTSVTDHAGIARQVVFSRKVLGSVLEHGGWQETHPSALEQDRLMEQIRDRTTVTSPRPELVQITYRDSEPHRTYEVTQHFAEQFIAESKAAKERESREAFEFIDQQVREYHGKLTDAEAKLEQYRNQNPDARPGVDTDVNARIGELRRQIETAKVDLIDLHSVEGELQSQLSGESEISVVKTRASVMRARLAELQSERDRLLLTYTAQYPDVVRVQHQIRDLEEELREESTREQSRVANQAGAINASSEFNPLYAELRSKLADAQRRTAATNSRITTLQSMLNDELARSSAIASSESALAELTRDYEVNRDLYQDLLKRRENARVSMNLDAERRGLSFRIQEPAELPLRPAGVRLLYVAIGGLLLAALVPLMVLFGLVKLDPRVRTPLQIEKLAALPVLGSIPRYPTRAARARMMRRFTLASTLFLTVPLAYGAALVLKWLHAQ